MAVTLGSTGITFPDSTTQTTAASAGGTVTAVASGTLPNGATVIVNSDGTVSVPTATGASTISTIAASVAGSATATNNNSRSISACYGSKDDIVVVFFIGPSAYLYAIPGKISGTTITFGSAQSVNSTYACSGGSQYGIFAAYDYVNNQYFCLYRQNSNGYGGYVQCKFAANLSFTSSNNQPNSFAISYPYPCGYTLIISPTLNSGSVQAMITYMSNNSGNVFVVPCTCTSSNTMNIGSENNIVYSPSSTYQNLPTFCDVPSKALVCYLDGNGYPSMVVVTLNGTSSTMNTRVQINTDYSYGYPTVAGYSATLNKYFLAWAQPGGVKGCVVTVSGTTPTAGTQGTVTGFSVGSGDYLYACLEYKLTGDLWFQNTYATAKINISGTTFTVGSISYFSYSQYPNNPGAFFYDDANYTWVLPSIGSTLNYQQLSFATAYSTTITPTNFIGFSSASYTNGQTATINTAGSTNSAQSGLTTGTGYYVTPNGSLTSTVTSNYAGVALSATKILIKG